MENEEIDNNLEKKFTLEDGIKTIPSLYKLCKNHPDSQAEYQCPICKKFFCEKCFRFFKKKKSVYKGICVKCRRKYNLKFIIFYFNLLYILFTFIDLRFNLQILTIFFQSIINIFGYLRWKFF